MTLTEISSTLLEWYGQEARSLPWRGTSNPYYIWVSEIMLQQTRVETVIPYYQRWIERFPTVKSLAAASEQEVLALWEGLGYYGRARNLLRTARRVVDEMGGKLPQEAHQLARLPGIGRYTAAAIASIAFGEDAAALDGNIRRVLARVFNVSEPVRTTQGEKRLWELAEAHLPPGQAGDYNQAWMDLGATICTPRSPDCPRCPLNTACEAFRLGIQELRPVVLERPATPHYTVTAAVIQRESRFLITQRLPNGLLGSLWEFPGGKVQPSENLSECLLREIREELDVQICIGPQLGVYRHAYTHYRVTLHAFFCALKHQSMPRPIQVQDLRWVELDELSEYPMGKIDRQIARDLQVNTTHPWKSVPC